MPVLARRIEPGDLDQPPQLAFFRGLLEDAPPGVAKLRIDGDVGLEHADLAGQRQRVGLVLVGPDENLVQTDDLLIGAIQLVAIQRVHVGKRLSPPARATAPIISRSVRLYKELRRSASSLSKPYLDD